MNKDAETTIDLIAKLICEDRQREIEELREYLENIKSEAARLRKKYSTGKVNLSGDAHDLYDFLFF